MKKTFSCDRMPGIVLALALALTGCPEPTDPAPAVVEKGVLGQISGVVYDTITAQPVEGVTVELSGSSKKTTTDKGGTYLLQDVLPGDNYTLAFSKSGYRLQVRYGVGVTATAYKTDDPFGEWAALQSQLRALEDWVKDESNIPDGGGGPTGNWTYTEGGIWIDGNGTAVTLQNINGAFKVTEIKMNYTYRKGIGIAATGLVPLSGAIKGQIKLFKVTNGDKLNVAMADAVPIEKGIQVWFQEPGYVDLDPDATTAFATPRYGPVSTGDNGSFEFTGLPVNVALTLVTGAFSTEDGYSYAANATAYKWAGAAFTAADGLIVQNTKDSNQHTNVGDIYFFTAGNYALISAISAGSIAQPISRNGSISLSFSKPINPGTFSATLNYNNASSGTGNVTLSAEWSADVKQVELKANIPSTGLIPGFPYSANGTQAVGTLQISGRAADGSSIFADGTDATTAGIPVYTTEGVKLTGVDIAPASVPGSRTALTSQAIKLSFSKPLNTITSKFNWGTGVADYTFADSNATVYVWTDLIPAIGASLKCDFTAEADPFDKGTKTIGADNEFTKAPSQQKLILESTNIYNARLDPTQIVADEANFPYNGNIELTFSRAIPATAIIRAALSSTQINAFTAATLSPISVSISGAGTKTLTIDPADLYGGQTYYLAVEITNGAEVLFSSVTTRVVGYDLNGYKGIIADIIGTACRNISFKTAPIALNSSAWASGDIKNSDTSKYSFNVTAGTPYWVWWNDQGEGDGNKTGNVTVSAEYLGGANIFTTTDSGWTTPKTFTASTNGTVILSVNGGIPAGTFGIVYRDSSTRP